MGVVVGTLLLAGCASPSTPAAQSQPSLFPPASAEMPWVLEGCMEVSAYYLVPTERVQPFLPEGFTPAAAGPGGMAQGGMNAFRCATGRTAGNGTAADVTHGSFFVRVKAPDGLAGGDGICCRYVKWNTVVADPGERAALLAAGASVQDGSATFPGDLPAAPGPYTVTLEMEGVGTTTFSFAAHDPGNGAGSWRFREFSPTPSSPVVWESTAVYRETTGGEGTVEVPAGSIPAQMYGSTRIPATFSLNHLDLEDGWIRLP